MVKVARGSRAVAAASNPRWISLSTLGRTPWWVRFVAGTLVSIVLGYLALRALDWGQVYQTFKGFPIGYALLCLLLYFLSLWLRAYRWYVLFVEERISLIHLAVAQNAGTGVNNMLPVRVMAEPVQLALVTRRYGISGPTALATLATEHVLDIIATAMMMGLGVLLIPELRGISIQLTGALILGVVSLGAVLVVLKGMPSLPLVGRVPSLERWTSAIATLRHHRLRLTASFLASVGHWLLLGLSGWVLARGLGLEVNLGAMVVMFLAAALFINSVPSAPGAAGTFEFAIIYTLGFFDISRVEAVPFALVMHVIIFLPPMLVMLLVLSQEGLNLIGHKRGQMPAAREVVTPTQGS